jgi:hypothetical protein
MFLNFMFSVILYTISWSWPNTIRNNVSHILHHFMQSPQKYKIRLLPVLRFHSSNLKKVWKCCSSTSIYTSHLAKTLFTAVKDMLVKLNVLHPKCCLADHFQCKDYYCTLYLSTNLTSTNCVASDLAHMKLQLLSHYSVTKNIL